MTDFAPLLARLAPVIAPFHAAGFELHLVGGMVRDHLLGADLNGDFDLTTDARPDDIKRLLRPLADSLWSQGERFGTIGAQVGDLAVEVTTYRSESYDSDSRKPEVVFGDDLRTDLSRRDFTINAMAVSTADGTVVDPFGGASDLAARVLRTPLEPDVSFIDDPLRMLRAARFIPRFGLEPAEELSTAAAEFGDRLSIVSAERIRDELERLLAVPSPRRGLQFLADHGLGSSVIPGFDAVAWTRVVERLELTTDVGLRRALLLVELGPPGAAQRMDELRYSRAVQARTVRLLELVPEIAALDLSDSSLRRLVALAGEDGEPGTVDAAAHLAGLLAGVDEPTPVQHALAALRSRENLTDLSSPLDGSDVMRLLDIGPGPAVGRALELLRQVRIEEGPLDVASAKARLRALLADS